MRVTVKPFIWLSTWSSSSLFYLSSYSIHVTAKKKKKKKKKKMQQISK